VSARRLSLPLCFAALIGLAALLYLPSLHHAFVMDDFVYISENPAVTRGAPLAAYFTDRTTTSSELALRVQVYRPLRTLSFRAVAAAFGARPAPYRALNVLLYALCGGLLLVLCERLGATRGASLLAAALWVAAPVHVEAVIYPSALGDQLSLFASLLSLLLGLDALRGSLSLSGPRALGLGAASLALSACALLCKELAIVQPALYALLATALLGRDALRDRRAIGITIGHGLVALLFLLARSAVLGQVGQVPLTLLGTLDGALRAPLRIWHYVRICLLPLGHNPAYQLPAPSDLALALAALALAVVLALIWRARRGVAAVWVGGLWFLIALLPVLNLVPVLADLADRFALLASVGLALSCAGGLSGPLAGDRPRRVALLACGASLLLFCAGTLVEARFWQSDGVLWRHAAEEEPGSAQAHANLGVVLLNEGKAEAALRELDQAQALGRTEPEVDFRRGLLLLALGREAEAEAAVRTALGKDGSIGRAHALLGEIHLRRGQLDEAEREARIAARLAPEHPGVLRLLAIIAERRGAKR
jgi:hypothetical protein